MLDEPIKFTVVGEALPAGSKNSFPVLDKKGNPIRTKSGRILTRVKHSNPNTPEWMRRVAEKSREVYTGPLLEGPLRLTLVFVRVRPKGHYGTGRNADKLKPSAPEFPTTRPDTLKLGRAVEDALTGILWKDDSQVVRHYLAKDWGDYYHVVVEIESLEAAQAAGGSDGYLAT